MADNKSQVLSKLIIHSFEKNDFKKEDEKLTFTNPDKSGDITRTNHIELDISRGHGQPGTSAKYNSTAPEELKIEFVLDGTKTMEGYVETLKNKEVSEQIKAFTIVYINMKGKSTVPGFSLFIGAVRSGSRGYCRIWTSIIHCSARWQSAAG